jgi:hypothetical protein
VGGWTDSKGTKDKELRKLIVLSKILSVFSALVRKAPEFGISVISFVFIYFEHFDS